MERAVEIVEVGARDGLQNEPVVLDLETKLALIERALGTGARRIEAVSFVRPDRVPQMAGAEELMAALPRHDGVTYSGLVLNRRGLERALASRVDEINVVVATSDTFNRRNQGATTAEALATWHAIASEAHDAGLPATVTISTAFGCPFEGEIPSGRVGDVAAAVAEAGPAEIVLADTIGVGVPSQVRELLARVREAAPGIELRCHFHNTRNTGYSNAVAAVEAGVRVLDASLGGAGGCPFAPAATGNISTEDLVYTLQRMGYDTGIDLEAAIAAGLWLAERLGSPLPSMLGRAGPFPGQVAP